MDKHVPSVELGEGIVRISGGTTPGAFPHLCPYRPTGATERFCEETTTNLQRNKAGCCGVVDRRNTPPCNSELRRCVVCLVRNEGKLKRRVVDLKRGLCELHRSEVDAPAPPKPIPTRSIHFAPILPSKRDFRVVRSVPRTPVPEPMATKPPVVLKPARKTFESHEPPVISAIRTKTLRMDRKEKLGILKSLADRLRQDGVSVKITPLVEEATKKGGLLEGKTTPGSLRVFLYTLRESEKTDIGL